MAGLPEVWRRASQWMGVSGGDDGAVQLVRVWFSSYFARNPFIPQLLWLPHCLLNDLRVRGATTVYEETDDYIAEASVFFLETVQKVRRIK